MATLPPINRSVPSGAPTAPEHSGVRRIPGATQGIPFTVRSLTLPRGMRIEPSAGGALERTARKHGLDQDVVQELFDIHAGFIIDSHRAHQRSLEAAAESYRATQGSAAKIAAAKKFLDSYEVKAGKKARADVEGVLKNSGAAFHGPVIELLAHAAGIGNARGDISRGPGGGHRRYSTALSRVAEAIRRWLAPAPAVARDAS
jgi:hypothetical protein